MLSHQQGIGDLASFATTASCSKALAGSLPGDIVTLFILLLNSYAIPKSI